MAAAAAASGGRGPQQSESEDYYSVLDVAEDASLEDLRTAYMRQALLTHPDRVDPSRREEATARFQLVADAYYTLSNEDRRRAYDAYLKELRSHPGTGSADSREEHQDANAMFGNIFEDLIRPELEGSAIPLWRPLGAMSGAILGFIVGSVPGALAGGAAGGYLGQIRDAKGKSVAEVFWALPVAQRTAVLAKMAQQVLGTVIAPVTRS
ncbi:DnaJ-domain-containing protein [Hyaloraphidium curvatum]|nr:DnaJ-domain-containing protein [Hyaloraphidium curvatum]